MPPLPTTSKSNFKMEKKVVKFKIKVGLPFVGPDHDWKPKAERTDVQPCIKLNTPDA